MAQGCTVAMGVKVKVKVKVRSHARTVLLYLLPMFTSVPSGILILPPFGHNRHGPKIRWDVPFFCESWVPIGKKSPGPRPTSIPSGILVYPAARPQRTLAENGGLCPFKEGEAGSPSNTVA